MFKGSWLADVHWVKASRRQKKKKISPQHDKTILANARWSCSTRWSARKTNRPFVSPLAPLFYESWPRRLPSVIREKNPPTPPPPPFLFPGYRFLVAGLTEADESLNVGGSLDSNDLEAYVPPGLDKLFYCLAVAEERAGSISVVPQEAVVKILRIIRPKLIGTSVLKALEKVRFLLEWRVFRVTFG